MLDTETMSPPEVPHEDRQEKAPDSSYLQERLANLGHLTHSDIRAEWRRLYRSHPPKKIGRDLLELAVAWKLQERALGGLSAATKRQLGSLAQTMKAKGDVAQPRVVNLKPGARLLREWHGEVHEVLVLDHGFRWQARHWRSLSAIARQITGSNWSGPRFFALDHSEKKPDTVRTGTGGISDLAKTADA